MVMRTGCRVPIAANRWQWVVTTSEQLWWGRGGEGWSYRTTFAVLLGRGSLVELEVWNEDRLRCSTTKIRSSCSRMSKMRGRERREVVDSFRWDGAGFKQSVWAVNWWTDPSLYRTDQGGVREGATGSLPDSSSSLTLTLPPPLTSLGIIALECLHTFATALNTLSTALGE